MRATKVAAHEQSFFDTGVDSGGKKHILTPFEADGVPMIGCKRENGDKSFYYEEEGPKERIVVHFTQGYLKGDIDTLTKPNNHVSVAFVLARNGAIVNLWPSKYWSYHVGPGAQGGNKQMSSGSVAIEISNIGCLKKTATGIATEYGDIYCDEAEEEFFTEVAPFRERTHFATFTDAQYDATVQLLRYLTAKYAIPPAFLPPEKRYGIVDDVANFRGITTHVNHRKDKWDIGPAFDWDRVVAGVTA
jgi:N-acetyl-anhydromuramyl-L-alanine amidase AmpD